MVVIQAKHPQFQAKTHSKNPIQTKTQKPSNQANLTHYPSKPYKPNNTNKKNQLKEITHKKKRKPAKQVLSS